MPAGNVTYSAKWKADPNTPYRVEHYFQNVSSDGYTYMSSESKTGETSSSVSVANLAKSSDGMTFKQATVGGKVENSAAIRADGTLVIKLYYDRNTADVIFDSKGGSEVAKLPVSVTVLRSIGQTTRQKQAILSAVGIRMRLAVTAMPSTSH